MKRNELLSPLPAADWDESIQHIAQRLGDPLNIHKMIAHNPVLMEAYTPLRYHVVRDSVLSDRQREILILRVAHQIKSDYEWSHHVVRGQAAGLSLDEIERVRIGSQDEGWSADERHIIDCVDQMISEQQMTVETAAGLLETVGKEGMLDAVFTVAVYLALGSLLKTFDVSLES
ncbi:MAG: carboxymuconolactone decarboxylase family protein [Anaerolineae bacterium]